MVEGNACNTMVKNTKCKQNTCLWKGKIQRWRYGSCVQRRGYFQRAREGSSHSVCKVREMLGAAARWIVRPQRSRGRCAGWEQVRTSTRSDRPWAVGGETAHPAVRESPSIASKRARRKRPKRPRTRRGSCGSCRNGCGFTSTGCTAWL